MAEGHRMAARTSQQPEGRDKKSQGGRGQGEDTVPKPTFLSSTRSQVLLPSLPNNATKLGAVL